MNSLRLRIAVATGFVFLALFVSTSMGRAQQTRVPAVAADAVDLGPVPAAAAVSVRLYLAPDAARMAALDQLIADQQDSASPSYHHWLTPAEFGARFGAASTSVAQVKTFAENQGLSVADVAASGLRVTVSGTAAQVEQAFAPSLRAYVVSGKHAIANAAAPKLPGALAASVLAMGGLDTLTAKSVVFGAATRATDLTGQLGDVVDANTSRVVAFASTACAVDIVAGDQAAFELEAKEAAAQGITVIATSGCGSATSSFPAALAEVTAAAVAPGLSAAEVTEIARPAWQWAPGLPDDGLRHAPDLTVSDVNALAQTLLGIAASMPASADGTAARLGNINVTLYKMAPIPTVFTQADGAAAGTWEQTTGLGLVNLAALAKFFPRGEFSVNVSGSATNYAPTHGQSTTLMSTVSDISGLGGGAVPTGTITFALSTGATLGTVTLVNGSGSLAVSTLPGGSDEVIVSYSGDANYAAGQGYGIFLSVQGEPAVLSATIAGTTPLGGMTSVAVTASSGSGIGTPVGSVSIVPQGIVGAGTYTAPLTGSGGTSTATVQVPAVQAGSIVLLVNCVIADPSFTCYSPIHATAVVKQAASALSFTVSPNPPVSGSTTTFVGTVTGAAAPAPAPTGMVSFYDSGDLLGSAALSNGVATYTSTPVTANVARGVAPRDTTHAFTASYAGDVNYQASNATTPGVVPLVVTTTALAVSPNPPVNGATTTLTATLGYTSSGTAATGTVQFFEDAALIGTGTVNAGVATLTSVTITGTASHSFTAMYLGDTVYAASQSAPVTTQANTATVTTTTSVSASGTTVNTGSMVTLTGTIVPASTITGTPPTGTVSFTSSTQGLLGTAPLAGTTASLPVALTMAGTQSITATYSGDANYKASTSGTPVVVTVGTVITPVTLTVTPSTGAMYSNPVTAVVSVLGVSTTSGAGPAGSVVFSVASAGTTPTTATAAITPSTTTAGSASYTFAAPAPGAYTVTATCTGTNFTCTTVPVTATLATIKANTTTVVMASPAAITAGQTTTLTATITAVSPLATSSTFTGTVTFYNAGGVMLGTAVAVVGNQATLTTAFTSTIGNVITAVYSGDADWNTSTSAPLTLVGFVVPTTAAVSSNLSSALQGSNIIFTANISDAPSTAVPTPGTPTGTVTFYDLYNGQSTPLGTATLVANGTNAAVAQVSTTGLFHGLHTVTAIYAGNTVFATSSSTVMVNITDYSVTFSPASLSLAQGATGSATVTIAPLNGFVGTVALACTPPPGTLTRCSFSPASVSGGGVSTLTIVTTGAQSAQRAGLGIGASLTAILGCILFPRRRRPALLALVALCGLLGAVGCGNGGNVAAGAGGSSGSPLGTQLFSVVTAGNDGVSTNRHNVQFQVTIQ